MLCWKLEKYFTFSYFMCCICHHSLMMMSKSSFSITKKYVFTGGDGNFTEKICCECLVNTRCVLLPITLSSGCYFMCPWPYFVTELANLRVKLVISNSRATRSKSQF